MSTVAREPVSYYERECRRLCRLCANGLAPIQSIVSGYDHVIVQDEGEPEYIRCTAPTLAEFAEAQSRQVLELREALAGVKDILISPRAEMRPIAAMRDAVERLRQAVEPGHRGI